METIASYLPHDVQSLLPRSSPSTQPTPQVGSDAPALPASAGDLTYGTPSRGTLIAFVRHCGCPFAEKEVNLLGEVRKKFTKEQVEVVVVQHSDEAETKTWWERIGGNKLVPDARLVADPERQVYSQFGIGVLPWSGLLSSSMVTELKNLRDKEGIVNTTTGAGAWRWQNSGGLAVDAKGKVAWVKVAKDAGDVCAYDGEALDSLGLSRPEATAA